MNFEGISSVFFTLHKSILNAICGVPEHFDILMFVFDVWFCCYLSWPDMFLEGIAFLRCLILMLFVVAGGTFESHWLPSMLDFDAICGVPEHLAAFDAWSWCYLSWPEVLLQVNCFSSMLDFAGICRGRTKNLEVIAFLRCLILMLFVVAGSTFGFYCLPSMLDLDAICRGRTYIWRSLLFFDACFWCYLSWPDIHLEVIAFLWCLILMVYVVFQSTWLFYCLPSMLDFDAICGVPEHLAILLFALDVCFWCYLSWPELLLKVIAFLRCLILTLFDVLDTHMEAPNMFSRLVNSAL